MAMSVSTYLLLALCLTSYLSTCGAASSSSEKSVRSPYVTIPQGRLRGYNLPIRSNRIISAFTGVPYARPPVGDLRFKSPVAPTAWHGTYDATRDSLPSLQLNSDGGALIGDEDCLYTQIYTPKLPSKSNSTLLPVIVHIVGGGFKTANSSYVRYGPEFILDRDVVLVIPTYRLGILGFLSTGDEAAPGNFGLKDIVQVLKWIQENIKYFGGNPNSVTLMGESSGAMTVSLLTLSDLTIGLYHRSVTASGVAFAPSLLEPIASYVNRANQLGEYFGCPTNTSTLLVDCLRGIDASFMVDEVQTDEIFKVWHLYPDMVWHPTVEPDIEGALITDSPVTLFADGKFHDLPWLNVDAKDEGFVLSVTFYQNLTLFDELMNNIDDTLPEVLGYARSVSNKTAYTEALKSYYLNDLTADRSVLLANLTKLIGDVCILYPTYHVLEQRLSTTKSSMYHSIFNHHGALSYSYCYSDGNKSYSQLVPHSEAVIYLFWTHDDLFGPSGTEYSNDDMKLVKDMVNMVVSFATGGTPTPADVNGNILWEPYSSRKDYLQIGDGSKIEPIKKYALHQERMDFMEALTAAVPWKDSAYRGLENPSLLRQLR